MPAVAATVNLSQSNQAVTPSAAEARRLAAYFTPPYRPGPLPPAVDDILLRSAPVELHTACAAMVDSWGATARGSARISLRILAIAAGNAWLAYRCDSRLPRFENEYSERLAAFTAARGTLQFIDLAAPEDTRATLYHVGIANTLKLVGAENSAALVVFAVNSSPLDGAANHAAHDRLSENRFVVIANSASATKIALALVTARVQPGASTREASHSATSNGEEYRAALRFGHDLAGHLTAVTAYHRDQPLGARPRFGVIRYAWNPATRTFEVAMPVPLPPGGRRRPLAN